MQLSGQALMFKISALLCIQYMRFWEEPSVYKLSGILSPQFILIIWNVYQREYEVDLGIFIPFQIFWR